MWSPVLPICLIWTLLTSSFWEHTNSYWGIISQVSIKFRKNCWPLYTCFQKVSSNRARNARHMHKLGKELLWKGQQWSETKAKVWWSLTGINRSIFLLFVSHFSSCFVHFAFYFVVLCFCIGLCVVSPDLYSSFFSICVQVYWPLPAGVNPTAVNKYYIIKKKQAFTHL
jgi:hypothetical protein